MHNYPSKYKLYMCDTTSTDLSYANDFEINLSIELQDVSLLKIYHSKEGCRHSPTFIPLREW